MNSRLPKNATEGILWTEHERDDTLLIWLSESGMLGIGLVDL